MGYLEFKSYVEYKMFLSLNQTRFIFLFHFFIFFYLFIFFYINNKANLDGQKSSREKSGGGGGGWAGRNSFRSHNLKMCIIFHISVSVYFFSDGSKHSKNYNSHFLVQDVICFILGSQRWF